MCIYHSITSIGYISCQLQLLSVTTLIVVSFFFVFMCFSFVLLSMFAYLFCSLHLVCACIFTFVLRCSVSRSSSILMFACMHSFFLHGGQ